MGEIADDVINGDICQYCGQVFIESGEGYPRTCHSCIEDGMEDHLEKEPEQEINLDEIKK